jgi:hypothetical protein
MLSLWRAAVMTVNVGLGRPRCAAERPEALPPARASKLPSGGSTGSGLEPRISSIAIDYAVVRQPSGHARKTSSPDRGNRTIAERVAIDKFNDVAPGAYANP